MKVYILITQRDFHLQLEEMCLGLSAESIKRHTHCLLVLSGELLTKTKQNRILTAFSFNGKKSETWNLKSTVELSSTKVLSTVYPKS